MEDRKPEESQPKDSPPEEKQSVGAFGVLGSVFRAWFGVQSEKNRQRDFSSNDPAPFIAAGIIFAVLMVIGVIIAVKLALSAAGQ